QDQSDNNLKQKFNNLYGDFILASSYSSFCFKIQEDDMLVTTPDLLSWDTSELSLQATELPIQSIRNTLIELNQNIYISQN
ncbi:5303_t:CDS:1, partial [Racocetra persica]